MSPYPPFPLFTLIGFAIHAIVFLAIAIRFLRRWQSESFIYLGCAAFADVINFVIVLTFFFAFPNTLTKANIFLFNALVIKPFVTIFGVMSLLTLSEKLKKFAWVFFGIAIIIVFFSYFQTFRLFQTERVEFAYVHPAYPIIATQSEMSGTIAGVILAIFFFYHAFASNLFIRTRAVVLGISMMLLGASSLYWVSSEPLLYISMHIIGPIGSLALAAGVFLFHPKTSSTPSTEVSL